VRRGRRAHVDPEETADAVGLLTPSRRRYSSKIFQGTVSMSPGEWQAPHERCARGRATPKSWDMTLVAEQVAEVPVAAGTDLCEETISCLAHHRSRQFGTCGDPIRPLSRSDSSTSANSHGCGRSRMASPSLRRL